MQAQRTEQLRALHEDPAATLRSLIGSLRWQLGLERLARFAIRGAIVTSFGLIGISLIAWLADSPRSLLLLGFAPVLAALVLALVRWPSELETAFVSDQRLQLDARLTTAVELLQRGDQGRFVSRQVRDAVIVAGASAKPAVAFRRYEAALAAVALVFAVASVWLIPGLPRQSTNVNIGIGLGLVSNAPAPSPATDSTTSDELAQRALPIDAPSAPPPVPQAPRSAAASADLASRVQQEQAARGALDALSQALSSVSAAQTSADAIRQGDYATAASQLQNLGDNADQLSDAAKQQLAQALQQAAKASSSADRALAGREQQAAQALSRGVYSDQRQALRNLADQLQPSGARSASSAQLQRDLGQLEQQQSAAAAGGGLAQTAESDGQGGGSQSTQTNAQGGQIGGGLGQQGGAGIGSGPNADPFSSQPQRLETSGQQVQVPPKLGVGPGVRPTDGTEDQSTAGGSALGGQSTAQRVQAQQTGQVGAEQNLVPSEQRPLVRGYFR